jgi:hypothetical protein
VSVQTKRVTLDRRNKSPVGVARRKAFQDSIDLLRGLGLSSPAIEHYSWRARKTRRLPHELIREVAEEKVERVDALAAAVLSAGTLRRDGGVGLRGPGRMPQSALGVSSAIGTISDQSPRSCSSWARCVGSAPAVPPSARGLPRHSRGILYRRSCPAP